MLRKFWKPSRFVFAVFTAAIACLNSISPVTGVQGVITVGRERRVIPGYVEPNTPGAPGVSIDPALAAAITDPAARVNGQVNLNRAIYVRFFDQARTTPPTAILIGLPGFVAGSSTFNIIAPELVRLSSGEFEVWAVDRRANLLENTDALRAAETARTTAAAMTAVNAYVNDPAGRGGYISANPFSVNSFMSEWGLDVHLRDIKAIVDLARSLNAGGARPRVILLAGSVGAFMAEQFAGYNFDQTAGYTLIDGMVLMDGTLAPGAPGQGATPDAQYLNGGPGYLGATPGLLSLRAPSGPIDVAYTTTPVFHPLNYALIEIASLLALIDPNGPSALGQFSPSLVAVPASNAAALAINLDDELQPLSFARFGIGFLKTGPGSPLSSIADKISPDPTVPQPNGNPNGVYRPRNLGATLQQWDGLKDLASIGLRGPEASELGVVAKMFLLGTGEGVPLPGETNLLEWYFPQRLIIDIFKAQLDSSGFSNAVRSAITARGGNPITLTENRRVNLPVLAIRAQQGILQSPVPFVSGALAFTLYRNTTAIPANKFKVVEFADYTHVDLLTSTQGRTSQEVFSFVNTIPLPAP